MSIEIKKEIQLEIAHVLFIDIVGYSKLSINEQRAAIDELTQAVRASEQVQNAEAAARLIKIPTGDGMALVFYKSPEEPVECALEISRALKEHAKIKFRMGVHSGPVSGVIDVNGQANLAGAGLNVAQRVMDCGDAGHILLSKRVADDLGEYEHWRPLLHDLGECEVKHGVRLGVVNLYRDEVGNPQLPKKFQALKKHRARMRLAVATVALLALAAIIAGIAMFSRNRGRSVLSAPEKSIAVLPFENRSEDKANAYFADGIQDEILTRLSKIADLKVISRTSTQHYKSAPENLPEIARQLGVANILEGSVQKSGDVVRVNVQLIRAINDSHLWADTFDRKLTDIFSVESEMAKAIAERLRAHLTGREEQVIAVIPTDNVEGYDAYLRGLAYTLKPGGSPVDTLGAQKYLREAVRLDPKFALAWALLSNVDSYGYISTNLQPTVALREEARQAAETALTLQPNLGEAVWAKGFYHYACLKDYDTAVRYFEQARPLLPNSSRIPESLAYLDRRRGQWGQSENYFNEAERLDPRNVRLLTQHALSYIWHRRFPEALRKLDQVLDIMPDDVDTLVQKAAIAQAEGDDLEQYAQWRPLLHDLGTCQVKHGVTLALFNLYSDEFGNPASPCRFPSTTKPQAKIDVVAPNVPKKSIAILPFENLSEDKANEYFADGIQEEILTRLSHIADLKVISRTSTQRYKNRAEQLPEIATQLAVANILEGSVRKAGDKVRVHVQLIDAENDAHLWAERYDRQLTDIFDVESDIAEKIADALQAKLSGAERRALAAQPTTNMEAHQWYLQGRYHWRNFLAPGYERVRECFERAIALDPSYAPAYAGLSLYYGFAAANGIFAPDAYPPTEENAQKALRLDPTLGEALNSFAGFQIYYKRDWPAAERTFKRGAELNPNFADIRHHYGVVLTLMQRNEEALEQMQRAMEFDPFFLGLNLHYGKALFFMREYDLAIAQFAKTLEMNPNYAAAHEYFGDACEQKGMQYEAITQWTAALALSGQTEHARVLEQVFASAGFEAAKRTLARRQLEDLDGKRSRGEYVAAAHYVFAHVRTGNFDDAFAWLPKMVAEPNWFALQLRVNPVLDPLRRDQRFEPIAAGLVIK